MSASWIDPLDCCRYRSSMPLTFSHLMLERRVVAALRCSLAFATLLMSACLMSEWQVFLRIIYLCRRERLLLFCLGCRCIVLIQVGDLDGDGRKGRDGARNETLLEETHRSLHQTTYTGL